MVVLIVDFVECFSINVKNIQIDKRRKKKQWSHEMRILLKAGEQWSA